MVLATLVVAGAVLTGTILAAPAHAADITIPSCDRAGPCVVVEVLNGTTRDRPLQYLYADQITGQADVTGATYRVRDRDGNVNELVVEQGSSLSRLVGSIVPPAEVRFAEVVWNDTYGRHLLTPAEAGGGPQGGLVPAFYSTDPDKANPTRWNYVRPQRNADDANGAPGPDQGAYTTDPGGAFLVRVHLTGDVLQVGVSAEPVAGSDRRYTLSTNQSGPGLTYDWRLPDGSRSNEATPVFAFRDTDQAGSYPVDVGVERDDGSFGWGSGSVRAGLAPTSPPTPSATPSGSGGNGPADEGPTNNPEATLTAAPNPNPSGSSGPSTQAPTLPPTEPLPTESATEAPGDTPTEAPTETPPTPNGSDVTGVLLAAQAGSSGGVLSDAPRPSPAARPLRAAPLTVPGALLVVVGMLALLGLGAASESGAVRRRVRTWLRMGP